MERGRLKDLRLGKRGLCIGIKKTSIPGRTGKRYPKQLEVSVVRVQEKGEPDEKPIAWTLLSSHPVGKDESEAKPDFF